MTYTHLSEDERDTIAVMRAEGSSLRSIAKKMKRDTGTLSRELKRNAPPVHTGYYLPHKAHERAVLRSHESHTRERLKNPRIRSYVRQRLKGGWSPELTAGRWNTLHSEKSISHEAIYQWIYADAKELIPYLVRARKKREHRGYSRKHKKPHIPNRISISQRPKEAILRKVAGHWETDTAVSRQSKAALQITTERKTRYTRIAKLPAKTAHAMRVALTRRLSRVPARLRTSITYDNGTENTDHEETNRILGITSYFCEPYHSWEKGTVENTIGLVRRFLPKKTDFGIVSRKDIQKIERWLNNRPRKCLNFKTPAEAMRDECCT
ncbi:MAG: IS30 family transposase [Actinomycetota bacterium]